MGVVRSGLLGLYPVSHSILNAELNRYKDTYTHAQKHASFHTYIHSYINTYILSLHEYFLFSGVLTQLHTAFSREGASKVYVQHLMLQDQVRVYLKHLVLEQGAYVYVCGATAMGATFNALSIAYLYIIVNIASIPLKGTNNLAIIVQF